MWCSGAKLSKFAVSVFGLEEEYQQKDNGTILAEFRRRRKTAPLSPATPPATAASSSHAKEVQQQKQKEEEKEAAKALPRNNYAQQMEGKSTLK